MRIFVVCRAATQLKVKMYSCHAMLTFFYTILVCQGIRMVDHIKDDFIQCIMVEYINVRQEIDNFLLIASEFF